MSDTDRLTIQILLTLCLFAVPASLIARHAERNSITSKVAICIFLVCIVGAFASILKLTWRLP